MPLCSLKLQDRASVFLYAFLGGDHHEANFTLTQVGTYLSCPLATDLENRVSAQRRY